MKGIAGPGVETLGQYRKVIDYIIENIGVDNVFTWHTTEKNLIVYNWDEKRKIVPLSSIYGE